MNYLKNNVTCTPGVSNCPRKSKKKALIVKVNKVYILVFIPWTLKMAMRRMYRDEYGLMMSTNARHVVDHECGLARVASDAVISQVRDGYFIGLRRCVLNAITVDKEHPMSKRCLKSTAQIEKEKERHLLKFAFVIHPFSKTKLRMDMFMLFVFMIIFLIQPINVIFPTLPNWLNRIILALNSICLLHTISCFFIGYYDSTTQKVVLGKRKIIVRHLKTYFFFDLMSSLPIMDICEQYLKHSGTKDQMNFRVYIRILYLFKYVRVFAIMQYLNIWFMNKHSGQFILKIMKFLVGSLTVIFCGSAIRTLIAQFNQPTNFKSLLSDLRATSSFIIERFLRIIKSYSLVGYEAKDFKDLLVLQNDALIVTMVVFVFVGFAVGVAILVKMNQICTLKSTSESKYNNLVAQITEYMKYKELPPLLKDKILIYADFKFQKQMYKEQEILSTLSSILKQDILMHTCKTLVENVEMFKEIPSTVMLRLILKLKTETYIRDDNIIRAGTVGNSMYFIYVGSVAVYTASGTEICHLHEGDNFGEIALVVNQARIATVVAITECEVLRLHRRDFEEALGPYPNIMTRIQNMAYGRLETTTAMHHGT